MKENYRKEVDITDICKLLWNKRKRIVLNCFFGGVLSIIIAFSIPKEYTSTVILAPEFSGASSMSGNLGSLASMAGIDFSTSGEDALYPELYPQIVSSTPFLCDLLVLKVQGRYKKNTIETSLYDYLNNYQRMAWWSKILSAPSKLIMKFSSLSADTIPFNAGMDCRHLTRRQQLIMSSLDNKINIDVDKGTSVITLSVSMQDANIASDIAQAVSDNLQTYIGNYRTAKAKKDLEQTEKVFADAQNNYYQAQRNYAEYSDKHQNITQMKYKVELDRLSNEQDFAFNVYGQVAQQLELSKSKLQEKTPVVVEMQPSVVPFKASSPKKIMIGFLFVFLAFFGTVAWLLIEEYFKDNRCE